MSKIFSPKKKPAVPSPQQHATKQPSSLPEGSSQAKSGQDLNVTAQQLTEQAYAQLAALKSVVGQGTMAPETLVGAFKAMLQHLTSHDAVKPLAAAAHFADEKLETNNRRQERIQVLEEALAVIGPVTDHTKLDPEIRQTLEKLVGLRKLELNVEPAIGKVSGSTQPFAQVEAYGLSADSPVAKVVADEAGHFELPTSEIQQGDWVQVRTQLLDGSSVEAAPFRFETSNKNDKRNAPVFTDRIGMRDLKNGTVEFSNKGTNISEPGAIFELKNVRTKDRTHVTLDIEGKFPANVVLPGKAGDIFLVSASDGKNNVSSEMVNGETKLRFYYTSATLRIPGIPDTLPEPALHRIGEPTFANYFDPEQFSNRKLRFTEPLFRGEPSASQVFQGFIDNCYFPATLSAIAKTNPAVLKDIIKENADGTFTVTFKKRDIFSNEMHNVEIRVDSDLYVDDDGYLLYGHSSLGDKAATRSLWFPLIEKAYAQFRKNSYNNLGHGGLPQEVMTDLLGIEATAQKLESASIEELWASLTSGIKAGIPVVFATPKKEGALASDHAFSLLSVHEADGKRMVKVRASDGRTGTEGNGEFDVALEDLPRSFIAMYRTTSAPMSTSALRR